MANWVRYPPPLFLSVSPLESVQSGGAIPPPPPQKGYLSGARAIPYENWANGCDTPLCDTISKGYCAMWGGISHWAAKGKGVSSKMSIQHINLGYSHFPQKIREKTKGQQLKGKIVSEFFTLLALFHTFSEISPTTFPFKTKGFSSMRTKEKKI